MQQDPRLPQVLVNNTVEIQETVPSRTSETSMFSSNTDCSGNSSETSMFSSNTDCSGDSSSMSTEAAAEGLDGCEVSLGGSLTSRRGCLTGDLERSGVSGHGVLDQDGNSSSDDDLIWSVSAGPLMISVTSSLLRPAASPRHEKWICDIYPS